MLDPIFIFLFDMGVKGAALATILSQAVSAVWVVRFLVSKKSIIRIRKKYLKLSKKIVGAIAAIGISPFIMQSTESLVTVVLNNGLQKYGALGQAKLSLFAALLRKVILLVPLAIILPKYFGVSGIYYAEPIADIIAVFVTSVLFLTITRKFLRNCGNNDMMGKRKQ